MESKRGVFEKGEVAKLNIFLRKGVMPLRHTPGLWPDQRVGPSLLAALHEPEPSAINQLPLRRGAVSCRGLSAIAIVGLRGHTRRPKRMQASVPAGVHSSSRTAARVLRRAVDVELRRSGYRPAHARRVARRDSVGSGQQGTLHFCAICGCR